MRNIIPALVMGLGLLCFGILSAPAALAKEQGKARITVKRTSTLLSSGGLVDLELNGVVVTKLADDGTYSASIPAGDTTLSVTQWLDPGRYKVKFKAVPGRRYVFVVSPRTEQFVATVLGGVAGALIDTAVNENSGAFKITPAR